MPSPPERDWKRRERRVGILRALAEANREAADFNAEQSGRRERMRWQPQPGRRFRLGSLMIGVALVGLLFGLAVEAGKEARALARWADRRYHRAEAQRELHIADFLEGRAREARRLAAAGSSAADRFGFTKTSKRVYEKLNSSRFKSPEHQMSHRQIDPRLARLR